MKKTALLQKEAVFTFIKDSLFFVETMDGEAFVWSDPKRGGNNTFSAYLGSFNDLCEELKVNEGETQGVYLISEFCGTEIKFISASHH